MQGGEYWFIEPRNYSAHGLNRGLNNYGTKT
jgi:hypothetical protein